MKIQHRAALEVVAGTVLVFAVGALVSIGLDALMEMFGMKGILILMGVAGAGIFMNLIYQIRVSQLKYTETLKQTLADLKK